MKAEDACLSHHIGEAEDKAEGLIWVDVLVSYCDDTYGSGVLRLVDTEQPA